MGICKPRYVIISICFLQMLSVIQRQIFDFLGFLWIPILFNFFEIVFVIFGFFGAFQYHAKYIICYSLWTLVWLSWNMFLICLYLDIGILNHQKSTVLKLDPDSGSWWEHGPGCKGTLNTTFPIPMWENVTDCFFDYRYVEIFQAGLQCLLAVLGILTSICLIKVFLAKERGFNENYQMGSKRPSLYSIEFSQQYDRKDNSEFDNQFSVSVSPKPMTPRRVKRRSVMTRGSSTRQSSGSRRYNTSSRSSVRSSRRTAQNPVTQLLEQQRTAQAHNNSINQSLVDSFSTYSLNNNNSTLHQSWQNNGHSNPTYQQSSLQSLNDPDDVDELYNNRPASVRSSYSNYHGARFIGHKVSQQYNNHATPQVPQKRNQNTIKNQNAHSMVFLNSGPPAYSSQNQGVADSETTI